MQPPKDVAPRVRIRGMILTAGIAAITIVGTLVGAGLKTDMEAKEKRKMINEPAGEDDLIAALETRRRGLVQTRASWEKKAETLRERMESSAQRNIGRGSPGGSSTSGK
ncbi:uncharacterized protein SPSK_06737 [Sporothrix schenckii 1099-18]|uniref:Uncharacterized protein n=2 Tax=Sporothrix schenckii TaxID=29908 RepID=U7PRK7_SPOS1|nr:uncharacterized protein SPSK_06737 [Sporothrix schenckii 1099-18]ERS98227.1 hypothetical protein HMPREF1624_05010 [Sporothrix schenckii ATCC 58251]KJR89669.1 hypothetical protein SPSK_06737 [Sporothrix schenckii 1099-18]